MLSKLSNEQLARIALYSTQITGILIKTFLPSDKTEAELEMNPDDLFEIFITGFDEKDNPIRESKPQPVIKDYYELDRQRRERDLSRLCGRWETGGMRRDIEISRAGEHFILTSLKRNGRPSDERNVLLWLDGDILYYGECDRVTVVALNTETDTLMISPGMDYTRVPTDEKK